MLDSVAGTEARRPPTGADRSGLWIGLSALGLLAGFGLLLWTLSPAQAPDFGDDAHVLPVAVPVPAFHLVDQRGEPFDRSRLEGRWSLLFFGYTACPDVCPMTLQSLARVRAWMDERSDAAPPQMVFVSVDPTHDTTARLAEYVAFFHPALVGASGEKAEIDRLTGAVGAVYRQTESDVDGEYRVDHSSSLFLVDPEARLHAVLHEPREPGAFVDLLEKVQAFERSS